MNDTFHIPVTYKGKEIIFKAKLLNVGYSYKIEVQVDEHVIVLEPDEERNYRATVNPELLEKGKVDVNLIRAIIEVIGSV